MRWLTKSALKKGTPLDSENSTCATLRGHLSNSWVLVFVTCSPEISNALTSSRQPNHRTLRDTLCTISSHGDWFATYPAVLLSPASLNSWQCCWPRVVCSDRHICDFRRLSCVSFFSRFVAKRQRRRSADRAIVHSSSLLTSGQSLVSCSCHTMTYQMYMVHLHHHLLLHYYTAVIWCDYRSHRLTRLFERQNETSKDWSLSFHYVWSHMCAEIVGCQKGSRL